jgi:hypothetical protein
MIAYERSGSGPALILVDGALCSRAFGPGAQHRELSGQTHNVKPGVLAPAVVGFLNASTATSNRS